MPTGHSIHAVETDQSKGHRIGYSFRTYSPISPYLALGEIRDRIRNRLATTYLHDTDLGLSLTHDTLVGTIDYSEHEDGIVLEVDGRAITMGDLCRILASCEGFEVQIQIRE